MTDLFTAAELRATLPDLTIADATATSVATQASALVREFCDGQGITTATYTHRLPVDYGARGWFVQLPQRPATALTSITVNGVTAAGAVLDQVRNRVALPNGLPAAAVDGLDHEAVVTYVAGYAAVPAPVKAVALALAGRMVTNPIGVTESSTTLGAYSESLRYGSPSDVLSWSERRVLARYGSGSAGSVRLS